MDGPGDWIGAVGAPGPRGAFTARVAALVGGRPGRALLLNLAGGPDEVRPLLDPGSPVAVLVESTDPELARCTALRPVVASSMDLPGNVLEVSIQDQRLRHWRDGALLAESAFQPVDDDDTLARDRLRDAGEGHRRLVEVDVFPPQAEDFTLAGSGQ